eukprot:1364836-Rhodomonas_salina.2
MGMLVTCIPRAEKGPAPFLDLLRPKFHRSASLTCASCSPAQVLDACPPTLFLRSRSLSQAMTARNLRIFGTAL